MKSPKQKLATLPTDLRNDAGETRQTQSYENKVREPLEISFRRTVMIETWPSLSVVMPRPREKKLAKSHFKAFRNARNFPV